MVLWLIITHADQPDDNNRILIAWNVRRNKIFSITADPGKILRMEPMKHYRQHFIRRNLMLRADILRAIRLFFVQNDYLEVETPIRIPAPAPETHIDAQEADGWFLQTSPELCMKRLLAAGFPRIFQICRCFRKQERGRNHLPEFTLLEWYTAGHTYLKMMIQCENLIQFVAATVGHPTFIMYRNCRISLSSPWDRMTVSEAFDRYAQTSMIDALAQDRFDEIMATQIEPFLGNDRPLFIHDYPASCSALARLKPDNPSVAERFELYVAGLELCNAFTELTDPIEQRSRFEAEQRLRRHAGKQVYPLPESFLTALNDMPLSSGNAMGVDRLILLLTDANSIDDVVSFIPEELE
jgi:lysyl-tRNA synthetase class 2